MTNLDDRCHSLKQDQIRLKNISLSLNLTELTSIRIVCISDTHGQHSFINRSSIPDGDLIIHTGDICKTGSKQQLLEFTSWFEQLPHKNKFLIGGNHDYCLQGNNPDICCEETRDRILKNAGIELLHDRATVLSGVNFYGTPWQLPYKQMAFNLEDSERLKKYQAIPEDTHVLLTHNPPHGILDKESENGPNLGCCLLRKRVDQLAQLKVCIFGHIHLARGKVKIEDKIFINASMVGAQGYSQRPFQISQEPFVIDLIV